MKILAFAPKESGPAYHRVVMPLMLMDGPDVFVTNAPTEERFASCDLFFFSRILPDGGLERLIDMRSKYGFKIVCDVDDWWYLDKHHILYEDYQESGFAEKQIAHLRAADVVLTTHDRLAQAIQDVVSPVNAPYQYPTYRMPEVHVCPNAIPCQGQFSIKREHSPYVRLFWQGSITHQRDIEIIERPIANLSKSSKDIKMVMAGFHQDNFEWNIMARLYTADLKHQYKLIPAEPVTDYYKAYAHADICLVPLVNSPFNRMKSNLKILEAANMGLPVIASAVHPYLDMPVNYCRSGRDWEGHIRRLVKWPKRRKEEGQRLAEFCKEHYNFHKINSERKQILEHHAFTHR